jgi:hypothetical protein
MELGRGLDPAHRAPEVAGEQDCRPSASRRYVEHARIRIEPETLAEKDDLFGGGRVLELMLRLRDHVVARDHGAILPRCR